MDEIDEERRVSFDARAALYDAVRPSYPDALIDAVIAHGGRRVLEIGAGTGKATLVFARRGASVVALEPGPALAAILRANVAACDVTVVESTFEAWPIGERFDVVTAAQSIDWVEPGVRYVKAAAALRPGGTLAVIRNEKGVVEPALRDELNAAYARHRPASAEHGEYDVAWARRYYVDEIDASELFGAVEVVEHAWTDTATTARYLDLLDTYSDHAVMPPERRVPLYESIASAIDRRGGTIEIPYVSMAFIARAR